MNGSQIVSSTFAEMLPTFFGFIWGIIIGTGILYLGKAIWISARSRRSLN